MKVLLHLTVCVCLLFLLSSCGAYRNRILFSTEQEIIKEELQIAVADADKNYIIQPNDFLEVEVYTNDGELLIDPNREIAREVGMMNQNNQMRLMPQYLVLSNGVVELPLVGEVEVAGYTLKEATDLLKQQYEEFYEDTYVLLRYVNKRVIVLGAAGGQVIPLMNENTNLVEVLALAGGVGNISRTDNIRLIRGNLDDPEVRLINLSTVEGMKQASLKVLPGDIIYVQPVQRITSEVLRDISPIFSLITSTITLVLLITQLSE
ncbi:polysaccharide biosynthesis/export family protein [Tunicatimonas pelagia]|uniref:polysaccharide biosynthesis/export family protein n=1 Tax=Tunicatimonas pelagia TaxID=931531 RepID=UPI0026669AD3|nr:polysaccharide biosynthesis/export family protein [Tunicatimonas pelagia]WKN45219.1 polysaccharide biosynthesis/export family protein [Tunicatimonas pelagia]